MHYASSWSRFLSACSDITIVRLLLDLVSLAIPAQWFIHKPIVVAVFAACVFLTYFASRIILNGQTFGMWLFGYRVVKSVKAKRLTWFEEMLRFVSQWISALLFFLPFVYSLFNKKNLHFSDLVVDSVPERTESRFGDAWPFQKFLGMLLIVMAINGILAGAQKVPAIDIFGRIIKGELARGIHLSLAIFSGYVGVLSIFGKKAAPRAAAILYLILLLSSIWSIVRFDDYQQRATKNLKETLVSANSQAQQPLSDKMLKSLVQESERYMQGSLKNATRVNLVINIICFFYMVYLIFRSRLQPYLQKFYSYLVQRFERMYNIVKLNTREKGSEKI